LEPAFFSAADLLSACPGPVWALLSDAPAGFFLLPPISFINLPFAL
jgi:hypothetical protein